MEISGGEFSEVFLPRDLTCREKPDIILHAAAPGPARRNTRSGIEEVITSTTGNRVAVMSGTRVRIPPTPPNKS